MNIAARLEGIAEPGGIVVSGAAYDHIKGKVKVGFENIGTQRLKNIAEPVRAFRADSNRPAGAMPALALPDKPSIAVLPFQNMSGDPEQEFFSDGMTEDIITALSIFRSIFVIARNSTFVYKGRAENIKQIGRDLGVRYVLEGSVRKSGGRVRITAQLIEAETGNHIWAQRYDRVQEDVFELQNEITETIVAAIEPELESAERERARRKPPTASTPGKAISAACGTLTGRMAKTLPGRKPISTMRSCALVLIKDYENAVVWGQKGIRDNPQMFWPYVHVVAALGYLGRAKEAAQVVTELLRVKPNFSMATIDETIRFKDPAQREHFLVGLRKAGLSD